MANRVKSVKFNFIMNSILTASSMIFPIITYPYVSRILQPDGIGIVSFANSVIMYFSMFAQLGVPTYGIRACAKVRDDKEKLSRTVQEIMLINLFTCLITYLAFGISLYLVPQFRQEKLLYMIMGSLILFNTIGVEWLYKGLEQYSYITVRSIIFKFIALVAMFLLIKEKEDYVIYGGITIFAAAGSNVLNFLNLRRYIFFRPVGNYDFRQHIKPISIFFAMSIATTVYTNMDNVMLGFIKGTAENGYYDAAVKIKNILVSFVTSLGTVLLPRVSYYIEIGEKKEFNRIAKKALNFVFLISIPLCVYFILFSKPSIYLLSGASFDHAVLPMQLIMPTLVFIGLTNIIGLQIMVPLGKEKQVLYSEIAGAVVNIIVNMLLIPRLGATGAALGTVMAEISVFIVQVMGLREQILPVLKKVSYLKITVAVGVGCLCSIWIYRLKMNDFLCLVVSAVLFFGSYGVALLISREKATEEIVGQIGNKLKKGRKN